MEPERVKGLIHQVRVAFRDVDPLALESAESDEYDDVSFRAASVLLATHSAAEAVSAAEARFRDDWGCTMTGRKRRLLTARLRHVLEDWQ